MEYVTIIIAALALLAAVVSIFMLVLGKKRSKIREERICKAMTDYVRVECEAVSKAAAEYVKEEAEKLKQELQTDIHSHEEKMEKALCEKLEKLNLDYTEAQNAADHVNDFASSLANIFDYDPLEAIRRTRKNSKEGG